MYCKAEMNFLVSNSILLLLLLLLILLFTISSAQPLFLYYSCNNQHGHYNSTNTNTYTNNRTYNYTYTNTSTYFKNLNSLLSDITSQSGIAGFYKGSVRSGDQVNAIAFCHGDTNPTLCKECLVDAASRIQEVCPNQQEAIVYYNECMLRYSNRSILAAMELSPIYAVHSPTNASNPDVFNHNLGTMLHRLQSKAAAGTSHRKYAVDGPVAMTDTVKLYALVECTPDLTALDCSKCIKGLISYVPRCCESKIGAFMAGPSCDLSYRVYQFFSPESDDHDSPSPSPLSGVAIQGLSRHERERRPHISLLVAPPTLAAILLLSGIWICLRKRNALQAFNEEMDDIKAEKYLQFNLATIRTATCNFALDNKLGEGGFGEVYKGKLPTGQEIAVKRLSKHSGQGITEFKNEIILVAKLQHKNLVKLLGFCLQPKEKILVYEYLSNSSLDRILFGPTKNKALTWETRFKIILGIARGLLYLHEDSRLKVIHRDIKTSNILLDECMNPKISDFGLAKLFVVDQTQGDTNRIVGTYGYMAPEYAVGGHFSVKSDVFSFGVILLEIISGQKNRYFSQVEEALVHRAWRLWNEKEVLSLVDPALHNKYGMEEVIKFIHIGLLSVQEVPNERPKMTTIVSALNGDSISLPAPKAPRYFGNSTIDTESSLRGSYSYTGTENITDLCAR